MRSFLFFSPLSIAKEYAFQAQSVLEKVAAGTDTRDLIVAFYFMKRPLWNGGTAYAQRWMTPQSFQTGRGKWSLTRRFPAPNDLPERYKLIRLKLTPNGKKYPLQETDRYGWEHRYGSFEDQLAFLFAHELHHFRRFHLGFHKGEGEQSANRWALEQARKLGFDVASEKLPTTKKARRKSSIDFYKVVNPNDFGAQTDAGDAWRRMLGDALLKLSPLKRRDYIRQKLMLFEELRSLPQGSTLYVDYDPQAIYINQPVVLVRALRRNSTRIVVRTADGKEWRWPMAWLRID